MTCVVVTLLILASLFPHESLGRIKKRAVPYLRDPENKVKEAEDIFTTPQQPSCPVGQLLQRHGNGTICCQPIVCTQGFQIQTCLKPGGRDVCVACQRGDIQLNNISSFNMEEALCFPDPYYNTPYNICPIEDTQKSNYQPLTCGLYCECKTSSCYVGNPCGCTRVSSCSINEQLNKLTKECEPCPKYSYKHYIGCGSCTYNLTAFSLGVIPVSTPQITTRTTATTLGTNLSGIEDPTTQQIDIGTVNEPQDQETSLPLGIGVLMIVSSIIFGIMITGIGIACCCKFRFYSRIAQKMCPRVLQSPSDSSQGTGSETHQNNLTVKLNPESEPLVLTGQRPKQELDSQISVESGYNSPGTNQNGSAPTFDRIISLNSNDNERAETSADSDNEASSLLHPNFEGVSETEDTSGTIKTETSYGINFTLDSRSSENSRSNERSVMTSVQIEIENRESAARITKVAGMKHSPTDMKHSKNSKKQDDFSLRKNNMLFTGSFSGESLTESLPRHETGVKLLLSDTDSSLNVLAVPIQHETFVKESILNEIPLSDSKKSEVPHHGPEYKPAKCDKSVDIQKSLVTGKENKKKIPVHIVRPMIQNVDASSICSYPSIVQSESDRMCDFVSDIGPSTSPDVDCQPTNVSPMQYESRAGPYCLSTFNSAENETELKQPVVSENTGVKCVFEDEGRDAIEMDNIPMGNLEERVDNVASGSVDIASQVRKGVRKVLSSNGKDDLSSGQRPELPAGGRGEITHNARDDVLPKVSTDVSPVGSEHKQKESIRDKDSVVNADMKELKEKCNTFINETDSLSGILPHTDSSVEISLCDIESRSDSVELELVSNLQDTETEYTDGESVSCLEGEREEGDGAYSVEIGLYDYAGIGGKNDGEDAEVDLADVENESVEIDYTSTLNS